MTERSLLSVRNLVVEFMGRSRVRALDGISFRSGAWLIGWSNTHLKIEWPITWVRLFGSQFGMSPG